jgi:hypothetical protein
MKCPKTVVIAITAHGTIPLYKETRDDEYTPHVFHLPTGRKLSVTKISAVVPGICNITTPQDVDKNVNYLIKALNKFDISTATHDKKKEFLDNALQRFHVLDKDQIREIQADLIKKQKTLLEKEQKTSSSDEDEIKEIMEIIELTEDIESDKQYLYHNQKYRKDTYNNKHKKDGILYKIYDRKSSEQLKSPYDYKINLLNVIGIPDLFSEMNTRKSGRSAQVKLQLSIEDIIYFLYVKKKVDEIIMFDFSCSSFTDGVTRELVIDERFIRKTRKSLLNKKVHGGNIKRRTRHNLKKLII